MRLLRSSLTRPELSLDDAGHLLTTIWPATIRPQNHIAKHGWRNIQTRSRENDCCRTSPTESQPNTNRLVSVDALHGFDMFWIIAGGGVVHAIHKVCGSRFTGFLLWQLTQRFKKYRHGRVFRKLS